MCPADNRHGPIVITTADGRAMCIHQEHDGRPRSHPLGYAPRTPSIFTTDELTGGQPR